MPKLTPATDWWGFAQSDATQALTESISVDQLWRSPPMMAGDGGDARGFP
jgi:hypothetical protein